MKRYLCGIMLMMSALAVHAQRDDGVLMDVQEVDIAQMKAVRMTGAEAVMKVAEQYTDGQYRFAYISNNYVIPAQHHQYLNKGKGRFTVAVAGYPAQNNLVYAQIFYDKRFFFVALAKKEADIRWANDMQITRVNYDKTNAVRRNNVRDTIQRNNIIPLGIDTIERY